MAQVIGYCQVEDAKIENKAVRHQQLWLEAYNERGQMIKDIQNHYAAEASHKDIVIVQVRTDFTNEFRTA